MLRPETIDEAATLIREQAATRKRFRVRGGGTKLGWQGRGTRDQGPGTTDIDTRGLNRIIEHNAGDFTAVLEAGVSLAIAQAQFAEHGQMLAIDPPLGVNDGATIGGIVATNDSGPMRHRYGGIRELVLGATVILSDGTVSKSGGTVIKNVAGYDLAKLFTGSFGTLGLIARVAVRLHPLPASTASVIATTADPLRMTNAVAILSRLPLEAECFDVSWSNHVGTLQIRFAGAAAEQRAKAAENLIVGLESVHTVLVDEPLWEQHRVSQRAFGGKGECIVKVSSRSTDLPLLIEIVDQHHASLVARAALGLSWMSLNAESIDAVRLALAPRSFTVLDGADRCTNPGPTIDPRALAVMKRIKQQFDPSGAFHSGSFMGGV